MLNVDMLCHCPNLPSMVICDVRNWESPDSAQNKEAV